MHLASRPCIIEPGQVFWQVEARSSSQLQVDSDTGNHFELDGRLPHDRQGHFHDFFRTAGTQPGGYDLIVVHPRHSAGPPPSQGTQLDFPPKAMVARQDYTGPDRMVLARFVAQRVFGLFMSPQQQLP